MVGLRTALPRLLVVATVGIFGFYGSFADAVVSKPINGSSQDTPQQNTVDDHHDSAVLSSRHRLDTSQSRVNHVFGSYNGDAAPGDRVPGKDYDIGASAYPVQNNYGPPKDYYYEERPEYFGQHHQVSGLYSHDGPPGQVYNYHQQQHQHFQNYGGGGDGEHTPGELNIKPLLWPLAGIALLGVLSALVKTPLLLNLGTVGPFRRRRRRRDVTGSRAVTAEAIESLLNKFNGRVRRIDRPQSCLVCDVVASIYDQKSACFERSVCEVMSREGPGSDDRDKQMLTAMMATVAGSNRIPAEFKDRLERSGKTGRSGGDCGRSYPCDGSTEQK